MSSYDDKLNDFILHVMQEANQKKESIEREIEAEKQSVLEEKELEFLTSAYQLIQQEKRKAEKQGNDEISKVTMEQKRALFEKREQIVGEIFCAVRSRIDAYLQTPDYQPFLFSRVEKAVRLLGDGPKVVLIDPNDGRFQQELCAGFPEMKVEISQTPIIGGCIVKNLDTNQMVDDSIVERLEESKEQFVRESGLKIE